MFTASSAAQAKPASYRGDWSADSRTTWRDDDGEPRVQINLRSNAGDSCWGFGVNLRDLVGLPSSALANVADNVQFSWTRQSGSFRFTGSFDQGRGNGTYAFTPDQAFITNMAAVGYPRLVGRGRDPVPHPQGDAWLHQRHARRRLRYRV